MKRWSRTTLITILALVLLGSTAANAFSPQEWMKGNGNELLSRVTTIAGSGEFSDQNGAALEASFRVPQGVAVLNDGSILVTDSRNHLIRKVSNGEVSNYAGLTLEIQKDGSPVGGWNDGTREIAVFNRPSGITVDQAGNVYISDTENHSIRKISVDGQVSTIAGDGIIGNEDGAGDKARFYHPQDVAVSSDGTLYIADTLNHVIRKVTTDGMVTTLNAPSDRVVEVVGGAAVLAGDYADGDLASAKFNEPTSIAIDSKGNLYVSDAGNHLIRYIDLSEGIVTTAAGLPEGSSPVYAKNALYATGGYADGAGEAAKFNFPKGIAVTEEAGLLIADSSNHTIRYLSNGQVTTLAGAQAQFGSTDGINGHNLLHHPSDVAVLPDGSLIIADSYNHQIRQLEAYELPNTLPQNDRVKVVYEDQVVSFDAQPEIIKGRTMIPIRALSELIGYTAEYDEAEQWIELAKDDVQIKLQVGSKSVTITKQDEEVERELDVAPYLKNGRAYVPLRFFTEQLGSDVQWDKHSKTVIIRDIEQYIVQVPASVQSPRTAKLEDVKGTVWVQQAGGAQRMRAFNGLLLRQGDRLATEYSSSAILTVMDRKDEITLSENSELFISELRNADGTKQTRFMLWGGTAGAKVDSLVNSNDTFEILTPTAVASARGTHFVVGINPATGLPTMFVSAGTVRAQDKGASEVPTFIFPSQQINIDNSDEYDRDPFFLDLEDFINQAGPDIIESLLRAKAQIDQENEEFLEQIRNGFSQPGQPTHPLASGEEDLERLRNNLEHLIGNIVKEAINKNKISENDLADIINRINEQQGTDMGLDLDRVRSLELTEAEKRKQEQLRLLEEQRRKQQEEKEKQLEDLQKRNQALLDRLQQQQERLQQENKKKQEEAKKRAEDQYKERLSEAEKASFERNQQELERQKQQQEANQRPVSAPTRPTPPPYIPTPPSNAAPKVIHPIANRTMHEVDISFGIDITDVFGDPDDDPLTLTARSSDESIATVELEGSAIVVTAKKFGSVTITVTASDGKGGTAETSFNIMNYPRIEGLEVGGRAPNYIDLWWGEVGQEVMYHIFVNDSDEPVEVINDTYVRIGKLEPNTEYEFRVIAKKSSNEIVAHSSIEATTEAIEELRNVVVTTMTSDSITVEWDFYGDYNYITYINGVVQGEVNYSETSYTFQGLDTSRSYDIRVEAWDIDYQSIWAANEISASTLTVLDPGITSIGFEIHMSGISMYWNEVIDAESYRIYINNDVGLQVDETFLDAIDLIYGEENTIRIEALNSVDTVIATSIVKFTPVEYQ